MYVTHPPSQLLSEADRNKAAEKSLEELKALRATSEAQVAAGKSMVSRKLIFTLQFSISCAACKKWDSFQVE